ncbi:transient receptor potential cation channel subfamily A member 1-like [Gossypium australe]|uniref:Transient receptor potential cation channel subfamily A member 1-like n=1 Tax=Gossypium australe TaxID=47621 RepID=A0A5B6W5Y7_9ROSI|nr:transient receptor potential cation channel subfamily A member 1-like [Gossypium australe]
MSTRGTRGRGTRGRGRSRRGARAGSSSSGNLPNLDTSEMLMSPTTEIGSGIHNRAAGDNALGHRENYRLSGLHHRAEIEAVVSLLRDEAYQW